MAGTGSAGRQDWAYLQASRKLKAQKLPCWLCLQPIDYTLEYPHKDSYQTDHYYPVRTHPHLANDPANLRPSHAGCNWRRGSTQPHQIMQLDNTTQEW